MTTTEAVKVEKEGSVDGVGNILYVGAPFDVASGALRNRGAQVTSSRDMALSRIELGAAHDVSKYGSYVKEGLIYVPKAQPLLVAESPLLDARKARGATHAHRNGKQFYLDGKSAKEYTELAEADKKNEPQERSIFVLDRNENFEIPTDRFREEEVTLFLFRDQAENYGAFLASDGIKNMPVWMVGQKYTDKQTMSFVRQLWLSDLDDRSELYGGRDLIFDIGVRGVSQTTGVASSHSTVEAGEKSELAQYLDQVRSYRETLENVRQGNVAASELEGLINVIDTFPSE